MPEWQDVNDGITVHIYSKAKVTGKQYGEIEIQMLGGAWWTR